MDRIIRWSIANRIAVVVVAVLLMGYGTWTALRMPVDVAPLLQPLSDAGFAWFSISYRLMNDVTQFGAGVEDVEAAGPQDLLRLEGGVLVPFGLVREVQTEARRILVDAPEGLFDLEE